MFLIVGFNSTTSIYALAYRRHGSNIQDISQKLDGSMLAVHFLLPVV